MTRTVLLVYHRCRSHPAGGGLTSAGGISSHPALGMSADAFILNSKGRVKAEPCSSVTSFRPGSSLVPQGPGLQLPMAAYDEDILKNPFYVALAKQRPDLCRRAAEHQGVVSPAPVSLKVDCQCFSLTCPPDYWAELRTKHPSENLKLRREPAALLCCLSHLKVPNVYCWSLWICFRKS